MDLQAEYPASFAALISGPLDPGCMGFDDLDSIPEPIHALRLSEAELPY